MGGQGIYLDRPFFLDGLDRLSIQVPAFPSPYPRPPLNTVESAGVMLDPTNESTPLHLALWLDSRQLPQEAGFIYSLAVAAKAEGCLISIIAPAGADLCFLPDLGANPATGPNARELIHWSDQA